MPKLKYDVSDVDPEARSFETPTAGVYRVKVGAMELTKTSGGDGMLKVQFEIVDDSKFKGAYLWENIVQTEASAWKMDQFLQAVKLTNEKKRKGELDTDRPQALPELLVRTKVTTYEGEPQAKVSAMLPYTPAEESDDEDDDGDAEQELDFANMSLAALRKLAKENDIDSKGLSKSDLIEALDSEPDEDDEEEPEDDDEQELDFANMTLTELRDLAKEHDVYERGMKRDALIAAIEEISADGEADDEDEEEAEDYSEWSLAEIKEEIEGRELEVKGPRSKLVAALIADDNEDPFAG